jgi:RNA polymerase sigma-70 factor (ECF subfamily)
MDLDELDAENARTGGLLIMFPSAPVPADPEAELARSHIRAVLERAVDELPEAFRTVFVLRDIEGMSGEETAEQLSIRAETVKTRLHRARKLLRVAIEARLSSAFAELFPFDGARCASMADRVVRHLALHGVPTKAESTART